MGGSKGCFIKAFDGLCISRAVPVMLMGSLPIPMRNFSLFSTGALAVAMWLNGCASHPRDFIPNGAALNLEPTNPAHVQVLDSVPRGMIIGTVLVDRAQARNMNDIIAAAREKAAAVGGDFIVWEDSMGTSPSASPAAPGSDLPSPNSGELAHGTALPPVQPPDEQLAEKTPKARFTVGIYLPEGRKN